MKFNDKSGLYSIHENELWNLLTSLLRPIEKYDEAGIYVYVSSDDDRNSIIEYVGSTINVHNRTRYHKVTQKITRDYAIYFAPIKKNGDTLEVWEQLYIDILKPRLNRNVARRSGKEREVYASEAQK